jgi:hypothetical protein
VQVDRHLGRRPQPVQLQPESLRRRFFQTTFSNQFTYILYIFFYR